MRTMKSFDTVVALTRTLSMLSLALIGILTSALSVATAIYAPGQIFGVIIAAIGCSIGTAIAAMALPRLIADRLSAAKDKYEQEFRMRLDIEKRLERAEKTENERDQLQREIERHKRMKIDTNQYRSILKLGVAELNNTVTDFKKLILEENRRDTWNPLRSERTEYVGVLEYKFRAYLGVDLTKLRFRDCEDGCIEVSGLQSEFQGMKDQKKDWLLREIRVLKHEGKMLPDDYKVLDHDGKLVIQSDAQENELTDRINNGINFRSLDDHIIKMASEFIRLLLSPIGKEIVFTPTISLDGKGFIDYLDAHNRMVESNILELNGKREQILLPRTQPALAAV